MGASRTDTCVPAPKLLWETLRDRVTFDFIFDETMQML
jgi:hypothetical protein